MTPQIELFGVTIAEPMTTLTDYAITVVSMWYAWRLFLSREHRDEVCRRAWALGFLFIGLGALLGGTSHGFVQYLDRASMDLIWTGTLYTIGISMFFAVAGTLLSSIQEPKAQRLLHAVNLAGFVYYAIWIFESDSFLSAIIVTLVSLGFVALLQCWRWIREGATSAPWIITGVLVSFASAAVQRSGYSLHVHFNHNDLYHVIQIAGLYLLYRGTCLLVTQGINRVEA